MEAVMAEKKEQKARTKIRRKAGIGSSGADDARERIIDAAMALAAERGWREFTMHDVAETARLPLGQTVALFPDRLSIIAAFMRRIDAQVLDGLDAELAGEPARERLLDVLISRFEAMAPYKVAVRSIFRFLASEPEAALALRGSVLRSARAMLAGAGIESYGAGGAARVLGLAFVFRRALGVWLDDDDPGMARTMAEIDRRLRDGERALDRLSGLKTVERMARGICQAVIGRRRRTREEAPREMG
jgi:AcrR family transcriptional regulator